MLVIRAARLEAYRGRHHRVQYEYFVPGFGPEGIQLFPQSLELLTVVLERDGGVEPVFGILIV